MPVSSEIAGRRMLTAEVFAFTTRVEMQVAASTALALVATVATSLIGRPSRCAPGRRCYAADGTAGADGLPSPLLGEGRPDRPCRSDDGVIPVPDVGLSSAARDAASRRRGEQPDPEPEHHQV